MAKLKDVQKQIEDQKSEVERFQTEVTNAIQRTEELRAERDSLLIAAEIEGDKKAAAKLVDIDRDLGKSYDLRKAVLREIDRADERIKELKQSEQQLADASGRVLVGKAMQTLDGLVDEFSAGLFQLTKISRDAIELCGAIQEQLTAIGVDPGAMDYRRFRNATSPRIVASLGRTAKLNLNASITPSARDWLAGADAEETKPKTIAVAVGDQIKTMDKKKPVKKGAARLKPNKKAAKKE